MGQKAESQAETENRAHVEQTWVYQGRFIRVRKEILYIKESAPRVWESIIHPGAVGILPIDARGNLILVEQWRRAVEKILIEIPAGGIEPGEEPLACAQRELQEEVGYKADNLIPIGGCYAAPGMSTEYVHLFIAKDLEESYLEADEYEAIDLRIVSLPEALSWIEEGIICDAKTIVGILRYAASLSPRLSS